MNYDVFPYSTRYSSSCIRVALDSRKSHVGLALGLKGPNTQHSGHIRQTSST